MFNEFWNQVISIAVPNQNIYIGLCKDITMYVYKVQQEEGERARYTERTKYNE